MLHWPDTMFTYMDQDGGIWKENPAQIVEKYLAWADAYQENQVTIVYDTMWQSTRKMAEAIADGIREEFTYSFNHLARIVDKFTEAVGLTNYANSLHRPMPSKPSSDNTPSELQKAQ